MVNTKPARRIICETRRNDKLRVKVHGRWWMMAGATGVRMFAVDQLKTTASPAPGPDADAVARHRELILEIRALRSAIEQREGGTRRLTSHPAQLGGIHRLRHELDLIHAAIAATKQDVEALQSSKRQDV